MSIKVFGKNIALKNHILKIHLSERINIIQFARKFEKPVAQLRDVYGENVIGKSYQHNFFLAILLFLG